MMAIKYSWNRLKFKKVQTKNGSYNIPLSIIYTQADITICTRDAQK